MSNQSDGTNPMDAPATMPKGEKPTTRLEDTPVVDDDGNVDMAELSKSGGGRTRTPKVSDFFLGFATALFLLSVTFCGMFLVVV